MPIEPNCCGPVTVPAVPLSDSGTATQPSRNTSAASTHSSIGLVVSIRSQPEVGRFMLSIQSRNTSTPGLPGPVARLFVDTGYLTRQPRA